MTFFDFLIDQKELSELHQELDGADLTSNANKRVRFPEEKELLEKLGAANQDGNSAVYNGKRFYWFYRQDPEAFEFGCPDDEKEEEWIFAINGSNGEKSRVYCVPNSKEIKNISKNGRKTLKTPLTKDGFQYFQTIKDLAEIIRRKLGGEA